MKMKEFTLTVRGVLLLFLPLSVQPFVDDDYDRELIVNPAIAKEPKAQIDKRRQEYKPVVEDRLSTFRWGVLGCLLFLLTAITVALGLAIIWHAAPRARFFLGGASIFVFAWSTLARRGRSATSFGGNTILERIDLRMLWILYWVGTLLGTLALPS
jgi:hypothetical protein